MRRIFLFVEDSAHLRVLTAFLDRLARDHGVSIACTPYNVRHGHPAVARELRQFVRDLRRGTQDLPDLLVVATDGNCKGYAARRDELSAIVEPVAETVVFAIPDPHVERWLLLDSQAFRTVAGKGCDAPDRKCERSRYKKQLMDSFRAADLRPSLGGTELAGDIVDAMDLDRVKMLDASLGRFLTDLSRRFRDWKGVA
ncbi:hypothetical protein [Azospirillum halopraeferens]|uniref:hypothetical protein n=1 Tax=Azospirillum halopraeferens TaxID=34010 RepID=UPI0003FB5E6D|nr:hypothetical protein [Azospirillum halopraeferens]